MKPSSVVLATALVVAVLAGAWLAAENARLRRRLAETATTAPVQSVVTQPKTISASPTPWLSTRDPVRTNGEGKITPPKPGVVQAPGHPAVPTKKVHGDPGSSNNIPFRIEANPDGTLTVTDATTGAKHVLDASQLQALTQQANGALVDAVAKRPGGPSWSPGQAAGAPDTQSHGDLPTAWASQSPDGGPEWLQLKYAKAVPLAEINIHESFNPGAVSRVSALMPDGSKRLIWEGVESPEQDVIERAIEVPPGITSDQILVELDTSRVVGWNEIDAVELVGRDGSRQWATESTASSYYGEGRALPNASGTVELEDLSLGLRTERR